MSKKEELKKKIKKHLMQFDKETIIGLYFQMRYEKDIFEQQIEELKAEIKNWKHEAHKACYQMEEYQQEKWDLQQQLKEKDDDHELLINQFEEETEKLREQIKFESDARKRAIKALKENTNQVCEKITQEINDKVYINEENSTYIDLNIWELLDKIKRQ